MIRLPDQEPRWVPVNEILVSGSIGAHLAAQIPALGERLRPETTFQQPFRFSSFNKAYPDFHTYSDLLSRSPDEIEVLAQRFNLSERLDNYLRGLLILPHTRLLSAAYRATAIAVPPEREKEIVTGVNQMLDQLPPPRVCSVLTRIYGLSDGIRRTADELREDFGKRISGGYINSLKEDGLRKIKQKRFRVRQYLAVPERSFGKEAFGAVLVKDLPQLGSEWASLQSLNLSADLVEAIYSNDIFIPLLSKSLQDLLTEDLIDFERVGIFGWMRQEITAVLQRRVDELAAINTKKQAAERRQKRLVEKLEQIRKGKLRNNLMPEIGISSEQIQGLDQVLITDLNLPVRWRNLLKRVSKSRGANTAADLLTLKAEDLMEVRGMGALTATEIKKRLLALLET